MVRIALAMLLGLGASAAAARSPAPLYDPVSLNIGLACQWQQRCISDQTKAMKRSLKYVKKYQPPASRLQICNRNAARKRFRVDWVGFNNCIRNASVRVVPPPPPSRPVKKRVRGLTQRKVPSPSATAANVSRGERGH